MNAENYARLLHFVLKELGARVIVAGGSLDKIPARVRLIGGRGVYSIWACPTGGKGYVPTYFGCTSRTFGSRLYEHCQPRGKIYQLYQGEVLGQISGIGIVAIDTSFPSAKAMESIFLSVFDFAQNVAENAAPRALDLGFDISDLDQDPPFPEGASDIEAFNDILEVISEQIGVMQKLHRHLRKLKE